MTDDEADYDEGPLDGENSPQAAKRRSPTPENQPGTPETPPFAKEGYKSEPESEGEGDEGEQSAEELEKHREPTPPPACPPDPQTRPTVGMKGVRGKAPPKAEAPQSPLPAVGRRPSSRTKTTSSKLQDAVIPARKPPATKAKELVVSSSAVGYVKRFHGHLIDSAKAVWFLTSWHTDAPGEPLNLSLQPTQDFQVEGTKKQRINILQAYQNHLRGMFPGTNVLRQQVDPDPVLFFVVFVCLIVETPFCVGLLLPSHGERKD